MRITANFDAGNIDVINLENKKDIQLAIRPDFGGEFSSGLTFVYQVRLESNMFSIF